MEHNEASLLAAENSFSSDRAGSTIEMVHSPLFLVGAGADC